MSYTGGFDSDEENIMLISSADPPNVDADYGATPQQQTPVNH